MRTNNNFFELSKYIYGFDEFKFSYILSLINLKKNKK